MNGNKQSPDKRQEADAPTTTRRTFLGAAAALATIPATTAATDDDVDVKTDDTGSTCATLPHETEVWSALSIHERVDDSSYLSAEGYHYADEPSQVELTAHTELADLTLSLSPEQARAFAEKVTTAAAAAETEEGDR